MTCASKFVGSRMASRRTKVPRKQKLCYDPLFNLANMAALKARDTAEEFFKLQNFDFAIKQVMVAKEFDPNFLGINHYILAYQIHKAVSDKKTLYDVLGIPKTSDCASIKKQYKKLALDLHPDKNSSVAAGGAFKHIKAACDVLSDPATKKAYDKSLSPPFRGASSVKTRKRAAPQASTRDDGGVFKKTVNIIRKTNQGQKACFMRASVCRVA